MAALAQRGIESELIAWDEPGVDWESFDLTVLRSTWDYASRREAFLDWASERPRLCNPLDVVTYSTDKHYLLDLERRGVPVVPSSFVEVGETPIFPDVDFVVKPAVGAGSIDAARYRPEARSEALAHVADLHGRGRSVLVQPYMHTVDFFGELALIFIDGSFSHAMSKAAMLNTPAEQRDAAFRRNQMSLDVADDDALAVANHALAERFGDLLYARVDLVAAPSGWLVMELELVEPNLFLTFNDSAAARLAAGIERRLN
jgi:glutathione synthase/RimK-type ligase-like ATP-grasp enzyme